MRALILSFRSSFGPITHITIFFIQEYNNCYYCMNITFMLSFLRYGVKDKRGVEFCHSTRNASRIRQKWGTECLNTRFPLPTLQCAGYSVKLFSTLSISRGRLSTTQLNSLPIYFIYIFYYECTLFCDVRFLKRSSFGSHKRDCLYRI